MLDLVNVATGDKRHRHSLPPRSPGPSNAVHVVFDVVGQIVVHHQFQFIHIDPAPGDIRRNKKLELGLLELVHDPCALRLRDAPVQPVGGESLRDEVVGKFVDHPLRVAENNAELESVKIHQPLQRLELHPLRHLVIPLLDRGHREFLLLDLHRLRIAGVAVDEFPDRLRDRRGEKHRLTLRGRGLQDFLDVIAEAHVQHAVCLVEDGHLQGIQHQRSSFEVVHDPPGRPDHDLHPLAEFVELAFVGRPAVDRHGVDAVFVCGEFVHLVSHLRGKLARGAQDQDLHGTVLRLANLDRRNRKGSGLARTRPRLPDDIMPLHQHRNRRRLDRRGLLESQSLHRLQHFPRDSQILK